MMHYRTASLLHIVMFGVLWIGATRLIMVNLHPNAVIQERHQLKRNTATLAKPVVRSCHSQGECNLTIISAYFDIGTFRKGGRKTRFSPGTYYKWARVFKFLVNPLVIYTDSPRFLDLMTKLRQNLTSRTKIKLVHRDDLWSFSFLLGIKKLFDSKGYPKHYPNTVIAEYPCCQHSKYELVAKVAKENTFNTTHYAWLDVGYFRNIVGQSKYFQLDAPQDLDDRRLGVNLVYKRPMETRLSSIFKKNIVWVGGGLFVGTSTTIVDYEEQYKEAVEVFLNKNLMNSDQQINFGMFSVEGRHLLKPKVELQLYGTGNAKWFYLGYKMLRYINVTD